jgi:hypothetical protein
MHNNIDETQESTMGIAQCTYNNLEVLKVLE